MTATHSLIGVGHAERIAVSQGQPVIVGRSPDCEAVIPDPTVSRRHAELTATPHSLVVRDLGSSNGTTINGVRVSTGELFPGDAVLFGKVAFRFHQPVESAALAADQAPEGTVVRSLPGALNLDASLPAQRLARILEVATRLSGEFETDKLIEAIVDLSFDLLPVDRVSLLLLDPASGELVPARQKSRLGDEASMRVPRSIVQRAVTDMAPILTENAEADERFKSGSVMLQRVRAAISTPLLASRDRVLGVLYVDTLTASRPFEDEEAAMLFAFGGLAAVSLGKLTFAEENRRQAQIRSNFERFFAPEVAARIALEPTAIQLAGDRRPATVLFSDIRGFTAIAETMAPDALSRLLTEYFTEMVDVVFEWGGTLDKFIGDAIMAVWGVPLAGTNDAAQAIGAARAMQARLEAFNRRSAGIGRPTLTIGIGINHGEVFSGYLGSERRLEYTVIGDTVNVASRLAAAALPGEIRVAEAVIQQLRDPPPMERVTSLELRGKRHPVAVYRLS
ncbi:MAG: adenylate/guanylate cyclase domain-containing protein [Gemmatimonadales bacterium]